MSIKTYTSKESIWLMTLSDIHAGAKTHQTKPFLHAVDIIKKSKLNSQPIYYCGIGDFAENITANCVADPYDQIMLPHQQVDYLSQHLLPLKGRGTFAVFGNHENRTRKRAYYDLMVGLCDKVGLDYLGIGGYVRFRVGNQLYTIAVQHGDCAGNWELEMRRMQSNYPEADLYLMGHTHDLVAEYRPYIKIGKDGKEKEDYKIFCRCGSFSGYPDYARSKNYFRKVTGTLKIKLHADKKLITVDRLIYINGELIQE